MKRYEERNAKKSTKSELEDQLKKEEVLQKRQSK